MHPKTELLWSLRVSTRIYLLLRSREISGVSRNKSSGFRRRAVASGKTQVQSRNFRSPPSRPLPEPMYCKTLLFTLLGGVKFILEYYY